MLYTEVKNTGLKIPKIIFGTSALGNLYVNLDDNIKSLIVEECITHMEGPVVFDTAGKYGAGLALEKLGEKLRELNTDTDKVIISNKLGWLQTELATPEQTFEKGVWLNIRHDAKLSISYEGILDCWDQGNKILGTPYQPRLVSVHDPDEYLALAKDDPLKRKKLYRDILEAYRALHDLKADGKVDAVGIGAKDWHVTQELAQDIELDWVMLANSLTIYSHPEKLLGFMNELKSNEITIINSAVFNAGFLTGGKFFNYHPADTLPEKNQLYKWRDTFFSICKAYEVYPANACVHFGLSHPAVTSVALNTSKPENVQRNIASVNCKIPPEFYRTMKEKGLIQADYPYI